MRILLVVSLFFAFNSLKGQNLEIQFQFSNKEELRSSASGSKLMQFNHYNLEELLTEVLKVNPVQLELDNDLEKLYFNCKITSSKYSLEDIKDFNEVFIEHIAKYFDISIEYKTFSILELKSSANNQKLKCSNVSDVGNEQKIIKVNRTWKGYCVNSEDVVKLLESWYGRIVSFPMPKESYFDITLHHDELHILKQELVSKYSISMENVDKSMPYYKVKNK